MAKVDMSRLARYADLALTLSSEFDGRESDFSGVNPDVSHLLKQLQGNHGESGRAPMAFEQREGMFLAPCTRQLQGAEIACVGVPLDTSEAGGLSNLVNGPRAVRYASAAQGEIHEASGLNVFKACSIIDWGDVELDGHPDNLKQDIEKIASAYETFAKEGVAPLTIGGAHIATYGILKGLSGNGQRPVALIHLDAHHNSSGDRFGPRLNDCGFFRLATVKGLIDPEHSVQAGLRGQGLSGLEFSRQTGMEIISARDFQTLGAQNVAKKVRESVGDMPCYLSMDTSVLECGLLPNNKLPAAFSMTPREIRDFLEGLCGIDLVGADIMEFSPDYDNSGISSALASALAFEMLGLLSVAVSARCSKVVQFPEFAAGACALRR